MINLTRQDTGASIALHRDLLWIDQHDWTPVVDSEEWTVTGALIVEPWPRQGGRPITLQTESEDFGLERRATVLALEDWATEAGLEMVLVYAGATYEVGFRNTTGAAVSARRVFPAAGPPGPDDLMVITLRLRTL